MDARAADEPLYARRLTALVAAVASVTVALATNQSGDYQNAVGFAVTDNPAPATNALADGRLHDFFALHPYMGSFSLLLRAPFVTAARWLGADDLTVYRLGSVVCVVALALLAMWVARLMARRGQPLIVRLAVVVVLVLNPLTLNAIWLGHPEEPLAAALCLGAALAARDRRIWAAGILLGLALATKQWAIVAVLPVLLAAPERRWRLGVTAAVVAASLALPLAFADPERFITIAREASQTLRSPATSLWAPLAASRREVSFEGGLVSIITTYSLPPSLGWLPRPLIVLTTAVLAFVYRRRRGGDADGVVGLLALCFLVRGMLDPISPAYYYVPFLTALAAWEGLRRRGLPLLTLLCAGALWFLFDVARADNFLSRERIVVIALYLLWALPVTAVIAGRVYRLGTRRSEHELGVHSRLETAGARAG
ncbi:MAG: glycosyltransferase 87 family protein [Solirubrobacteraceae bacterium]